MILNGLQKACLGAFIALVLFWLGLHVTGQRDNFASYLFVFLYGLIPLFGGCAALTSYRTWGGLSTTLGKAVFFIGWGLVFWGIGETIWSYYNFFLDVEIPYPSVADVFFAPSLFLYNIGVIFLSFTTGTRFALRSAGGKTFTVLAPLALFGLTYYLQIGLARDGQLLSDASSALKTALDLMYPIGDAVALSVAVVVAGLSFRYIGGAYKHDIASILLGLAAMFAADSALSYTTSVGISYSPDYVDLLFTVAVFLLTFGLLGFSKIKEDPAVAAD